MKTKATDMRSKGETLLKQCQLTEKYLLDVFVELCEKHNLHYFLDSGTLLGAMRHGGFIPWDDDIDVGMPVVDFKKFLAIAENELPDTLLIQKPSMFLGYPESFAKLRDRCSFFCEKLTNVQVPSGIYIDIFPFDAFPAKPIGMLKWLSWYATAANESRNVYMHRFDGRISTLVVNVLFATLWLIIYRIINLVVRTLRHYLPCNWRYTLGCGYVKQLGIPESELFPLSKVTFEGKEYSAPHNPSALLAAYYGDWRTLPPPEKRVWHSSIICPTQAPDAPWARKYVPPQPAQDHPSA